MKSTSKYILMALMSTFLVSCQKTPAGTMNVLNINPSDSIQVYRYYYDDGAYVYVSKFVKQPKVQTVTYDVQEGKVRNRYGNVILYENDSIQVIRKK